MVVVILAVLGAIVFPKFFGQIEKAKEAEAINNLGAIRSQELLSYNLTGKFVAAEDAAEIKAALGILVGERYYTYKIIDVTDENFLAVATPIGILDSWLQGYALDKDGFVGTGASGGGNSGSGSGGSSGGGSGGSGGSSGSGGNSGGGWGGGGTGTVLTKVPGELQQVSNPVTAADILPPLNLELTPNDGWLVLAFDPPSNGLATGYIIETAQKIDGVLQDWGYVDPYFADGGIWEAGWEDQVSNDTENCYRAKTYAKFTSGLEFTSADYSAVVCGKAAANTTFSAQISASETLLAGTPAYVNEDNPITGYQVGFNSGVEEKSFLDSGGMPVLFGTSPSHNNSLAYFNPVTKVEVLDLAYLTYPSEVVASLLAHETLHALWDQDAEAYPQTGKYEYGVTDTRLTRSPNSIDQEYRAFTLSSQAWFSLRGNLTAQEITTYGSDMEAWMNSVLKKDGTFADEQAAKDDVARAYAGQNLPPY